jgi:hypothetical protein
MRSGNLDRLIEIQSSSTSVNPFGSKTTAWTTFAMMRAQLLQIATDNTEGVRGNVTDKLVTFRTRWLDGVTLENQVVYNGQTFLIKNIKELGRRVGLDIICERVGP